MKNLFYLTLVICCLSACNQQNKIENKFESISNESEEESQSIVVTNKLKKAQFQVFKFQSSDSITLKGKQNTLLRIPAQAFVYQNSNVKAEGEITFKLKEFYALNDMILNNTTTVSNGKLLESGGMIFIEASCNGKKLELASDKLIDLSMPSKKPKSEMELFYGDISKDGNMNWMPTNKLFENENVPEQSNDMTMHVQMNKAILVEVPDFINPKCINCLTKYINLDYPKEALKQGLNGKLEVTITIDEQRKLSFSYLKGKLGYGIEEKIEQYLLAETKWRPALKKSIPVNCVMNLEFSCTINNNVGEIKSSEIEILNPNDTYEKQLVESLKDSMNIFLVNDLKKEMENDKKLSKQLAEIQKQVFESNKEQELVQNQVNYLTQISQLGWINCDRFLNYNDLTNVSVDDDSLISYLIVNNQKSILMARNKNDKSEFVNIPVGLKVSILSFVETENNIKYSLIETIVKNKNKIKVSDYKVVTKKEFEKLLKRI